MLVDERVYVSYGHYADAHVDSDGTLSGVIDALESIRERGVPETAVISIYRRADGRTRVGARWGGKPGEI